MDIVRINPDNADHMGFMFDLANACKDEFLDDFDNDEIVLLHNYSNRLKAGCTFGFIARIEDEDAGIIWVDVDSKKVGYIHMGLLPKFRLGFNALNLVRDFVSFCFNTLELRKVEGSIPTHNRAMEKLLRHLGFMKRGIDPAATIVNGKPENHVLLTMSKSRFLECK